MLEEELESFADVLFTLSLRPIPIPGELRPVRRLAVLVLMLKHCHGGRANVEQLHVLNWSIRTADSRQALLEFLSGNRTPDKAIVRYDPSLSRAIAFAIGE